MTLIINPANASVEDVPDYFSEVASLAADQVVTASTTNVIVPAFTIAYAAFQRLAIRYNLFYTTNAAADFKFRIALPVAAAAWRNLREELPPAATTFTLTLDTANNGTTDISLLAASGTEGFARGTALFTAPSTPGLLTFQFSQVTSDAGATTLRAGSFVEAKGF